MPNGWHRKVNNAATRERVRQYATAEHKERRAAGQRLIDSGQGHCWRCGTHLPPGRPWHLGHDDNDRTRYRGPECVGCNLRAAASKGARVANARRSTARHGGQPTSGTRNSRRW